MEYWSTVAAPISPNPIIMFYYFKKNPGPFPARGWCKKNAMGRIRQPMASVTAF